MIFLELFWTFFVIGAITFGGGYAMIAVITEQVAAKGWIDGATLVDFVAVAESTPGPIAVNMATFVGSEVGGVLGAACATLGVILPSFIVILIVAKCYDAFRSSAVVKGLMSGLKPAVTGLIASAAVTIALTVFFPGGLTLGVLATPAFYGALVLTAAMTLLVFRKVHPILIVCISAAAGLTMGYLGLL